MADELKDQRIVTMMSPSEVKAIDDWMFDHRVRSRGEAIRRLCQMGLTSEEGITMLRVSFQQMRRLIAVMRDMDKLLPSLDAKGSSALKGSMGEIADAIAKIIGQALTTSVPAVTMIGSGDIPFRASAREQLLAEIKRLDISTSDGLRRMMIIAADFMDTIDRDAASTGDKKGKS